MDWKARLLLLDGLNPSMDEAGRLSWGTLADAPEDAELVFLGLDRSDGGEKACFACVPSEGDARPRMANPQLWSLMTALAPDQLALYGGARSLVDWHARHRFCAQCGGTTRVAKGGWQRTCEACGADHFPRTDPVTIMLVEHGGKLLLGRGLGWPEGRFSALAGFVEPGETIEEGVAREVLEEVGVVAGAPDGEAAALAQAFEDRLLLDDVGALLRRAHQKLLSLYPAVADDVVEDGRLLAAEAARSAVADDVDEGLAALTASVADWADRLGDVLEGPRGDGA